MSPSYLTSQDFMHPCCICCIVPLVVNWCLNMLGLLPIERIISLTEAAHCAVMVSLLQQNCYYFFSLASFISLTLPPSPKSPSLYFTLFKAGSLMVPCSSSKSCHCTIFFPGKCETFGYCCRACYIIDELRYVLVIAKYHHVKQYYFLASTFSPYMLSSSFTKNCYYCVRMVL